MNKLTSQEIELIRQAFKFTDQHRSKLERTLESDKSKQKGHVVDPEHDKRLSENKDKKEEDEKALEREEEAKERQEETAKANRNKLMQLKEIQEKGLSRANLNENALRNNITYGAAISKMLGNNAYNLKSLQLVRASLIKQQSNLSSIEDKNELHQLLSHVAALMIKAGALIKRNG